MLIFKYEQVDMKYESEVSFYRPHPSSHIDKVELPDPGWEIPGDFGGGACREWGGRNINWL